MHTPMLHGRELDLENEAFKAKRLAGANPWGPGATTLEWQLPSPPPFHTWEEPPHILGDEHDHAPAIVGHGSVA